MEQRVFAGITVGILLLSSLLLYFSKDTEMDDDYYIGDNGLVPVWERVNQDFNTTGDYSYTLESGQYNITGPESVFMLHAELLTAINTSQQHHVETPTPWSDGCVNWVWES